MSVYDGKKHSLVNEKNIRSVIFPLTAAQKGIWFAQQLSSDSSKYIFNISEYLNITGDIDPVIFEHALRKTVAECESFHLVLDDEDNETKQRVNQLSSWNFPYLDFRDKEDPKESASLWMKNDSVQVFDLFQGPLFSFALIRIDEEQFIFYYCMHHIINDGYGVNLFTRRIADIYSSIIAGQPISPSPLTSFTTFVEAEQHYNKSKQIQKDKDYFLKSVAKDIVPVDLRNNPKITPHYTHVIRFKKVLSSEVTSSLKTMAKECGVSLAQFLTALIPIYLSKISAHEDIAIGFPVATRRSKEQKQAMGLSVNVLPLHLHCSNDMHFREYLQHVKKQIFSVLKHQNYQSETLRSELGNNIINQPMYGAVINVVPFEYDMEFAGNPVSAHILSSGPTDNLSITIYDRGGDQGLEILTTANASMYSETLLDTHIKRIIHFISSVKNYLDLPFGLYSFVSEGERQIILKQFNGTQEPFQKPCCVHHLFENQVKHYPDEIAVECNGQRLTYSELNGQANQLAHWFIEKGITPDSRIAILLDRSCELIVVMLAALKAGAGYIPMDTKYPTQRLQYMIEDSQPQILMSHRAFVAALGNISSSTLLVDISEHEKPWLSCSQENILPETLGLTAHHLAYIIYTSGSTGNPKGVMVEHQNLFNLIHWHNSAFDVMAGQCCSSLAGTGFDAFVWEIWPALCVGAYITMPEASIARDPLQLLQWWQSKPIDVGFLPTPVAELAFAQKLDHPTMRYLLVGGDKLHQLPEYSTHFTVVNNYGPTETTVVATSASLTLSDRILHIGRPVSNSKIYILDENNQLAPIGVPGEIVIGGVNVARGYLNRSDLTAQRFIADPFSSEVGARMYRSGDLGCWLADGCIEYLGRNDHQVKIRGFRIELGEIEVALRRLQGVDDAVVIARQHEGEIPQLVGYFRGHVSIEELRQSLSSELPDYMVPVAYVRLEEIPLTANGKVDRKGLPEPSDDDFVHAVYEAPQGKTEQLLAQIWSGLLGISEIGRNDDFFGLGGHSLMAVQLIDQLGQQGYQLNVKTLFDDASLKGLATVLDASNSDTSEYYQVPANLIPSDCQVLTPAMLPLVELNEAELRSIEAKVSGGGANVQDVYPLAPLQEGILFHHLLNEEGDPYITRWILGFSDTENLNAFIDALRAVISRHDIFRTAVIWEGLREPVQVVWREASLPLHSLPLEGDDVVEQIKARLDPAHLRLNVQQAPMMAAYHSSDPAHGRELLCLLVHHLCNDHTTLELLLEEVQAHMAGRSDELPTPLAFREFVARTCYGVDRNAQQAYFCEQLGDIDEGCTPFGLTDVLGDGSQIESATEVLSDELACLIREQSRQRGMSAAALFHLAWGLVMRAGSGHDDVVFGTVLFGRMNAGEGAGRMLGMFLNTLPLRLTLNDITVDKALKNTQQGLVGLLSYEHTSLVQALQCSGVETGQPLFNSLVNYRYQGGSRQIELETSDQALQLDFIFAEERTNYPLIASINDHEDGGFSLDIQADVFVGAQRIAGMLIQAIDGVVQALVDASEQPVATLPVLSDREYQQVVNGFNQTERYYLDSPCIHELFEAQALAHGDAIAVEDEAGVLSYAELNAQANQLARYLRDKGIGRGDLVAVSLERGRGMVTALLAVLKAGGAYVPMDPGYPQERLSYMLSDSQPKVLLTDSHLASRFDVLPEGTQVLTLDTESGWQAMAGTNLSEAGVQADDLAYVIYTSGSTGQPKGVMNGHRGVVNRLRWMIEDYGFSASDVVLQKTSFSFDVSVWEFFATLGSGARLVMAKPEGHKDPDYLREVIERTGVTLMHFVPPMLQSFLFGQKAGRCASLRGIFCSGDALSDETVRQSQRRLPGVPVHNLYGPTEAAVDVTAWTCPEPLNERVRIGYPVANTRMYLLDPYGEPVGVGVTGELYIGGEQVAQGYLNRPDLTAERFMADPFVQQSGARMYRTGDLGRWLADGSIEYLGRNDQQVKIRGFRIELGEIESALKALEGVADAVVLARRDNGEVPQLVGYYCGDARVESLRHALSAALPDYMVPAAYVQLEAIPLTANGKVDRKGLPEPGEDAYVHQAYEAPQGDTEQQLADIWSGLLGIAKIGRNDDFFGLGGHSLMAVQLASRIRSELGRDVSLADLFAHPQLKAQALIVTLREADELPAIEAQGVGEGVAQPLSMAQQRLWFLSQMDPDASAAYVIAFDLVLDGRLNRPALKAALDEIVTRHHVLRSHFASDGSGAVQIVDAATGFSLHSRRSDEAGVQWPPVFDLSRGPLFCGELIEEQAQRHRLRLAMHHIISDGWSQGVLFNELGQLYQAYCDGDASPLAPLALQYGDYAHWQRCYLSGDVLKGQQTYWEAQLRGTPDELLLPKDRARPAVQDYRGGMVDVVLEGALTGELKALSQRHGCTLYMTLLASWSVLMGQLSGQDDVVIGSPVAGRSRTEVEGLIGMFVNTQALRIDLSGEPDMGTLLSRVKQVSVDAQMHAEIPFEQVVEAVSPSRSLSHSPLFQVMLTLQNLPEQRVSLGDLALQAGESTIETAQFDLSLVVSEVDGELRGGLNYAVSLFDEETVQRYVDYWVQLLHGLVSAPEQPVNAHPLLGEVERHQVLHDFNPSSMDYPDQMCIHELVEAQARAHGDAIAVTDEVGALSYAELNAQANQLARYLRDKGIGQGDLVAVSLERGCGMVTALLAVLKAGGAYVPMDPGYPQDRLHYMLEDSEPKVLLTEKKLSHLFIDMSSLVPVIELDGVNQWSQMSTENAHGRCACADDLAYVIYTSGSTGQPKGVLVEHRNLSHLVAWHNRQFNITAGTCASSVAGVGFDAAVWEIWPVLCAGGQLLMPTLEVSRDPQQLLDWWQSHPIEVGFLSTAIAELAFNRGLTHPTLRTLLVGGDRLTQLPKDVTFEVVNNYGPTETTVVATSGVMRAGRDILDIGGPIDNTRVYLLNGAGQPVPVGVAGELYIGGAGVARGYLNRPDLTVERFMADPFSDEPGARMYRTGDLGRWLADGRIEYLGRNDQQVKIRGYRIELGEIEAALRAQAGIKDAVVIAQTTSQGVTRLIAYTVGSVDVDSQRNALALKLPDYMVPAAYVQLDEIPLTANGKVDRKGLPEPGEDAFVHAAYEAPQGDTEQQLADIWSQLLGLEKIGRNDDFFGLGGHSLMAVQLASRIRSELGRDVSLADLFAHPHLKAQASILAERDVAKLPAIEARQIDVGEAQPLSMMQQRLWFLSQMDAQVNEAYIITCELKLKGALNKDALKAALNSIVDRHHILRTRFASHNGEAVQIVEQSNGLLLSERNWDERKIHWPPQFDLSHGALIQGELIREREVCHLLRLAMHHIISDGWSLGILCDELGKLYQAYSNDEANPLSPLALQYVDYAHWQRSYLNGNVLKDQQLYWKNQLSDVPDELMLPKDRTRPAVQDYKGAIVPVSLDAELTRKLNELSQHYGCTLYMTLLASWSLLMGRLSGQDDVVIGSPIAGRTRTEVEGLIGMFVNTQALRIDLSGEPDVGELLSRVKQVSLDAQMHQDIPFEQVVEVVSPSRSLSHSPLFQVMLALQNLPEQTWKLGELELSAGKQSLETSQFDLSLLLSESDGVIWGNLNYAVSLFDEQTICRYLGYWKQLLNGLVNSQKNSVFALPILEKTEYQQVVNGFNRTGQASSDDVCIHELVEVQAKTRGHAIALKDDLGALSYAELNAQANQLACYLREKGGCQGELVAVSLERGRQMIIALLATLKAGGAYIPLDPGYPQDRLHYMLEDSEPKVLLTEKKLSHLFIDMSSLVPVIELDGVNQWSQMSTENAHGRCACADDLAYVIYTSGSTGQPKGVLVEHRNLSHLVAWHNRQFNITAGTCASSVAGVGFDAAVWEIWPVLCGGGQLLMPTLAISRDPQQLLDWWQSQPIEVGFLSTAIAELAFNRGLTHPTLRTLLVGGDRLTQLPKDVTFEVVNNYGPTETTVVATSGVMRAGRDILDIGGPIDNTRVYLLNRAGQPVPVGVAGELYIGGAGVARGYLNRPDLTVERFMADPFSDEPGARMYRTGDLGRWLADGRIEYLGRNDQQVKIRGYRIELGEIESALRAQAGIKDAVVIAQTTSQGVTRLIAYTVGSVDVDSQRNALALKLPDYMVPAAYVQLDEIPLTANGKVDRKGLPEPGEDAFVHAAYEAPQGDTEQQLADIWSELLGIGRIGRKDQFFELGGHSLMAVQLIERLREHGYQLSVKTLFEDASLQGLAFALQTMVSDSLDIPANKIPQNCRKLTPDMLPLVSLSEAELQHIEDGVVGGASNIQDIYPLAPLQEGILFHHLLNEEGDPYITKLIIAFSDQFALQDFMDAFRAVIARHDILRTAVVWEGVSEPVQVVWKNVQLPLQPLHLEGSHILEQMEEKLNLTHFRLNVQMAPMIETYQNADPDNNRELLCLLMHHLCNDHTTLDLLLEEVHAYLAKRADELPKPLAFREFVARSCYFADREEQRSYFKEQLGDIEEGSTPFGLCDVQGDGSQIESTYVDVPDVLAQKVRTQTRLRGMSAATLFHLAWGLVVRAGTGRDDVVLGTVLFGRMNAGKGSDRMLGMFLNTLPLRLSLSQCSVEDALNHTQQGLAALLVHEQASLVEAQQCSGVSTGQPLFSSLVNYRYQGGSKQLDLDKMELEIVSSEERTNYPLVISINDNQSSGGFSLDIQADAAAGSERISKMLIQALSGLVEALIYSPEQKITALAVLGADEYHQVIHGFNQTERYYLDSPCIHALFEAQALAHGDAIAVEDEAGVLSYAELNAQANQLARYLRDKGIGRGDLVAVSLERGRGMVTALLAVLKAGGAYVPMDPGYPQERLSYMLSDSQPKVLLTDSHLASRFDVLPEGTQVLTLDTESGWQAMAGTNLSEAGVQADDLAYVIYTSGSTGQPKGVMNGHRGVVNRLRWMIEDYGFSASDVVLQKTSFSFDVSVWEFFATLGSGARLVMAKPEGHKDPDYLREVIERTGVTLMHFVPPMLQSFLFGQKAGRCASLRGIFCSGDALSDETVRQSQRRLPGVPVHNLYGPTEAAVDVTAWTCPEPLNERVRIGYPVANTRMYLLDPYGEPVGVGVTGELYIGGEQVAQGYLNRPDLTAERFMADPFVQQSGARMYRTGDLGRWLADGSIEYLGRNDQQVKIRGFRIELGEIESALKALEGVADAVVLARRDNGEVPQLVGYYCGDARVESLRHALSAALPDYMVPAAYVQLEAIPLTANGKVDRKGLPEPGEDAYVHAAYEAPQGEAEQILAAIWRELLQVEQVGRNDDFFGLGGHSLMAVQLIERLRQQDYQLSVKTLFDDASLRGLACALKISDSNGSDGYQVPANLIPSDCQVLTPAMLPLVDLRDSELQTITSRVPGGAANIQDIYPLAPLQEGILFHHMLNEEGDPYVSRLVLGFSDAQSLNDFVDALRSVIVRHDILRTAIVWEGLDEPVQVVWRDAPLPLHPFPLDGDDIAEQMKARLDPAHLRLNVQQAPMMAAYHSSDPSHGRELLCLLLHHLCNDHTTLELLMEEVQAHLQNRSDELPTPLAFREFVARACHEVDREEQQEYFREQLGDIEDGSTPFGLTDVQGNGSQIEAFNIDISDEVACALRTQSRQRGMSAAALFHLAWGLVVRAGTGRDDVVFGTVLFGRMNAGKGADRMLGMFLNTLPLRLTLNDRPLDEVLKETQQRLAGLLSHEHTSLVQAQQCSGLGSGQPLFSTLLNYRYQGGSSQLDLDKKELEVDLVFSEERTNYPLVASVNDLQDGGFSLDILADTSVGAERIADMFMRALTALVKALVQGDSLTVDELPVLSHHEYQQVVNDFNPTGTDYPDQVCIHALFEAQARAHGDAIAVADEVGALSYAELNAQANQLARYLREKGIGRGDLVAVSLERGCGMVTALLAVLKAGGAYVPMDPGYPQERLSYMLSDSQPKVLVTDWERAPLFGSRPETTTLVLLEKSEDWSSFSDQNGIEPHAESSDLAYVIYTSGSTGQPKGVLVEHRNLSHLVAWHNRQFNITAGTCASSVAGVGFDAAVWEIWPVLCAGGQLLMPTLEVSRDPQQLLDWWQSHPIEVGFLSTAIAELAFNRGLTHPTLRTLLVGGDRLTQLPKDVTFEVVNNYGPTETTVVATSGVMRAGRDILDIGGPIDNTRVYLLNGAGQPVPVGVTGEMYIGGAGVARGYLNRPDLTVERFMADPFSDEPGARMYRTGDLGRWLADGRIEYLGRNDQQVKIRGYRIELGEIEAALRAQAGIKDAVVIAQTTSQGVTRLIAYTVGSVDVDSQRNALALKLPDYMVPAAYVQLDEIPLTANGKVDRKGLPEPGEDAFVHSTYEAPEGKLEVTLAKLWGELLGLEKIGRNDDFFELGGHSLLGVQLVTRIREKLSIEITITDLFKNPKLNALATRLTYLKLSKFNLSDVQALARQILNR
ncbi:MAG: Tyrocidine synthase 3 [Candidatus Celerinatantimonas neptuna]|nr:MAG: Tyrocidine synthase 3 [Candidatus Celerinatantimonas neptuna]